MRKGNCEKGYWKILNNTFPWAFYFSLWEGPGSGSNIYLVYGCHPWTVTIQIKDIFKSVPPCDTLIFVYSTKTQYKY